MFLFWSATFSYENLALPLAAFVVWWIGRTRARGDLASMVVAVVGVIAVTVTHHVVGFALSALLGGWWLAERVGCRFDKGGAAAGRDHGPAGWLGNAHVVLRRGAIRPPHTS